MKQDYTHLTVILDHSGSMQDIRDDTIGGFNSFLHEQQAQPGSATLTLVQFDSQNPYEVLHHFRPISEIPELTQETFVPRGNTPLLDALGRGIQDAAGSITKLAAQDRPARMMMVVVTDGQENCSSEYKKSDIEKLVKEKTEADGWQFVFLSADLAAMHDARSLSIPADSSLYYARSRRGSSTAWSALSGHTSALRSTPGHKIGFKPGERKQANAPDK